MDKFQREFAEKLFAILMFFILSMLALPVQANAVSDASADPVLEKRVVALTEELRCLVCQNQTIADSNADLAIDLKNQVREKLMIGMSDEEVLAYMVERYGDFVLYRPPVKSTTWLLWFGPFLLLLIGLAALMFKLAKRTSTAVLSEAEVQRAAALLDNGAVDTDNKK